MFRSLDTDPGYLSAPASVGQSQIWSLRSHSGPNLLAFGTLSRLTCAFLTGRRNELKVNRNHQALLSSFECQLVNCQQKVVNALRDPLSFFSLRSQRFLWCCYLKLLLKFLKLQIWLKFETCWWYQRSLFLKLLILQTPF